MTPVLDAPHGAPCGDGEAHAWRGGDHGAGDQGVQVCGGHPQLARCHAFCELVPTHPLAQRHSERAAHPDHLPPEKVSGALWTGEMWRALAVEVGPVTMQLDEANRCCSLVQQGANSERSDGDELPFDAQ
jgi:hypothetical protein